MKNWYKVMLKCKHENGKLGEPISAEIIGILPRHGSGGERNENLDERQIVQSGPKNHELIGGD